MPEATSSKPVALSRRIVIELVVVIVVISILAGLLLLLRSALHQAMELAKVAEAKAEMSALATAIQQYNATYGRFPISNQATNSLSTNCPDFTFGTVSFDHWNKTPPQIVVNVLNDANGAPLPEVSTPSGHGYQNCNVEIMAILMDRLKNANGKATVNVDHQYNPQQTVFLSVKEVNNAVSPGLGTDGVYRDPWGNPYIITLDVNGDGKCRDAFYRLRVVSQMAVGNAAGHNGLTNMVDASGNGDHYEAKTNVMIWSFGPDRKIDSGTNAVSGANKDNIISW